MWVVYTVLSWARTLVLLVTVIATGVNNPG
jgi:hypothetical protein